MPYIYKMSNAGGMSTVTRYTDMLAGNSVFNPSSFDSISTVVVGAGSAASITFSSIPQTYKHLQIRLFAKNSDGNAFGSVAMSINGGAGEARHDIYGTGSANGVSGTGGSFIVYIGGNAQFGGGIVDILDYTDTNKTKVSRGLSGVDNNGSGLSAFVSGLETTQTAISSLTFASTSTNLSQYSHFALYGIKGQKMAAGTTYEKISSTTLGSASGSVTFSSIPATYTDLVLVINATMAVNADVTLIFNGDTANNYSSTYMKGNGTSVGSSRFSGYPKIYLDTLNTGTGIVQYNVNIMNYANSITRKTVISKYSGAEKGVETVAGLWAATASITSMTITGDGANFTAGSTFNLYGIAAA